MNQAPSKAWWRHTGIVAHQPQKKVYTSADAWRGNGWRVPRPKFTLCTLKVIAGETYIKRLSKAALWKSWDKKHCTASHAEQARKRARKKRMQETLLYRVVKAKPDKVKNRDHWKRKDGTKRSHVYVFLIWDVWESSRSGRCQGKRTNPTPPFFV